MTPVLDNQIEYTAKAATYNLTIFGLGQQSMILVQTVLVWIKITRMEYSTVCIQGRKPNE